MKTFLIICIIIVALLFLISLGKPLNEWFEKYLAKKEMKNHPKVKEKVDEIEKELKRKYPNLKEK